MEHSRPKISEYLFPALLVVFFVVVGTLPYLYGYWSEDPNSQYMGIVGRGALHSIGYLMFARQAQEGFNLFENKLTPEPLPRLYFHPEWWLYGKAARWTGLSLAAMWHVHRAIAVAALIFALYYLIARCLRTTYQRRVALSIIVFGAGFGWVPWCLARLHVTQPAPFSLSYDTDGVTVFGYLINKPHFILAGASIVLTYALLLEGERTGLRRYFVLSGLCALANLLIRAFAIYEICAIYALYPVLLSFRERRFLWSRFSNYMLAGSMLIPAVVYYLFLIATRTLGDAKLEVQVISFFQYIVRYGLPFVLLFLYFQGPAHFRRMKPSSILLSLWILVAFVIAQLHPILRNGDEAAFYSFSFVPAILIVEAPLRRMYCAAVRVRFRRARAGNRMTRGRFKLLAASVFVAFCMLSNVIVYGRMFTTLHAEPANYYIPDDLRAALKWLEGNTGRSELVLAGRITCPLIPYYAGNKTFTGHDLLTANRYEKDALADRFFVRQDDVFKRDLVARYAVHYVVLGPYETRPTGIAPAEHPWLQPVFTQGTASVFRVREAPRER